MDGTKLGMQDLQWGQLQLGPHQFRIIIGLKGLLEYEIQILASNKSTAEMYCRKSIIRCFKAIVSKNRRFYQTNFIREKSFSADV